MAENTDSFPKLASVYRGSGSRINQISQTLAKIKMNESQTGNSRVNSRPSPNLPGDGGPRGTWYPQNSSSVNVWGQPKVICKLGKWGDGESGGAEGKSQRINGSFPSRRSTQYKDERTPEPHNAVEYENDDEDDDDEGDESDSDIMFDSDDDLSLDDTDDESHEKRKKSKWFRGFFDDLDGLTNEKISSNSRKWHCPACHGGVGAIDWYQGLQPLMTHAKTIKARRVRLHRLFAETLEWELHSRKAPISMGGEAYGRWEGLDKQVKDHEIVWPPMVVVMNTRYEQDEKNKWTGMGNQELLDCFSEYAALKARHSYGPQGHRGMSVLIFEASVAGYLEAVRLHKHFKEQGRDKEAWNRCQNRFVPGGKRQLYGFLASMEDLNLFNRHSGGKTKLKFDMRSYQEMVESKIKQINDEVQQVDYFKRKATREKIKSQVLEASLCQVSEKLRRTAQENQVVRARTKLQHEENKEEMDVQEQFFREQIQIIHEAINTKEDSFEKLQQDKREKVKQFCGGYSETRNQKQSVEKFSSFIRLQDKEMREFEGERDKLVKIHEEKKLALKKKLWQEELELEKEFETELTQLMNRFTSGPSSGEENYRK